MTTAADLSQDDEAWGKAYDDQQAHQNATASFTGVKPGEAAPPPPSPAAQWVQELPSRVGTGLIDAAVGAADRVRTHYGAALDAVDAIHPGIRNVITGALDAGTNLADTAHAVWQYANSAQDAAVQKLKPTDDTQQAEPVPDHHDPIYTTARNAVMDFRDALAVKHPDTWDNIEQQAAQFVIPFTGYSRLLGGLNGTSRVGAAVKGLALDGLTSGTAFDPHAGRFADIVQLERHTQTQFGRLLNTIDPEGGLLNQYISWASDHTNESDFVGRVKNAADMMTVGGVVGTAANVLKEGYTGLRYVIGNGVSSADKLMPKPTSTAPAAKPVEPESRLPQDDDSINGLIKSHTSSFMKGEMPFADYREGLNRIHAARTELAAERKAPKPVKVEKE